MRYNREDTGDLAQKVHDACEALRHRLRAGETCRAEEFLQAHVSFTAAPECAVSIIQAEWSARLERGELMSLDEWLERFPQWRKQLEAYFHFGASQVDILTVTAPASDERQTHSAAAVGPTFDPSGVSTADGAPLPPHDIGARIGQGSMGVVYRAHDRILNRPVALKKIRPGLVDHPAAVARFYHEARAAAHLRHPHIVAVYVMGTLEGQHCFTMPLVPYNLDQRRARFADRRAAAELIRKIAEAVHVAHERGIIHRDLKPGNILMDENDEPLVADFGLAVLLHNPGDQTRKREGTPAYMAPEQTRPGPDDVGRATDVWALGVLLYELLAGKRPFTGQNLAQLEEAILHGEPPSIPKRRADAELKAIVRKCLRKKPGERYATAQALADDLKAWQNDKPGEAWKDSWVPRFRRMIRQRWFLAALVLLLLTAGVVTVIALSSSPRNAGVTEVDPAGLLDAQLQQGQTLSWIGPNGKLVRSRWIVGDGQIDAATDPAIGVRVKSADGLALLELLPVVSRADWVLSAEVKMEKDANAVGVYFLHHSKKTDNDVHHFLVSFGAFTGLPNEFQVRSNFEARLRNGFQIDTSRILANKLLPTPNGWHHLQVHSTAEQVVLLMDGTEMGRRTAKDLEKEGAEQLLGTSPPPFTRPGGVGLLVDGAASFRSIVLQPLTEP